MKRAPALLRALDRASLVAMGLAVLVMVQPWWSGGLRAGFFATAAATLAQIVVAHLLPEEPA